MLASKIGKTAEKVYLIGNSEKVAHTMQRK
jgi:hypothetical protein